MFNTGDLIQLYHDADDSYTPDIGLVIDVQNISWQKRKDGTIPVEEIKYKLIQDQLVISSTRVTVLHPNGKVKIWNSTDLQHIPLNSDANTDIIDI